jgi:alkylation response protein AidB-like acyl-CoA dehydrogenase
MLHDAGYAGIHWPKEYGGRGASPVEHLIFLAESSRTRAPAAVANYVGLMHAGPTIIAEGTDEQRARFLPPILRGEHVWCQGFSEPDAGSDLAALRTRAVRDGDVYVVTGQKIWTSHSSVADYCELLVRTDPQAPKHHGISWLAMPMDARGITLRPLTTITGSADFAELFLDEVRVPVANRVGAEHDGWRVAMVTLGFERGTGFVAEMLSTWALLREVGALARTRPARAGSAYTAYDDAGVRRQLGYLSAQFAGLWALVLRNVSAATRGVPPTVGGAVFKLRYTELSQQLLELANRLLGRGALAAADLDGSPGASLVPERLRTLSLTIAGGSSQIQRNILAERGLRLPKC